MPYDAQLYRLASIARDKLCREAARDSHNLRCLLAHANLLDELLIELSAPQGGLEEYYDFDLLPQPKPKVMTMTPRSFRPVVVTVEESSEHELEDKARSGFDSSNLSIPMLYHDAESDSDSGSDSDGTSEDGDNFETAITSNSSPTNSTTSVSTTEEDVDPNEDELALHRTKSGWRLFGLSPFKQSSMRKDEKPMTPVTNKVQRATSL